MTDPVTLESAVKEYRAKLKLHDPKFCVRPARAETEFLAEETGAADRHTRAKVGETGEAEAETLAQKPLADRLEELFGGGNNPTLRKALYIRCQLTCQTFGKEALVVLRDVVQYALTARNPGNCFAYSIVRRFRENGFTQEI